MNPNTQKVIDFLHREVGITCSIKEGVSGFIEGVVIENGSLVASPDCSPSALLHEAAHLAITPGNYRHLMNGNLYRSMKVIGDEIAALNLDPDHPLVRSYIQMSDPEATAWAWAAGMHLGLPEEEIILDSEYENTGADIRIALSMNAYVGINGLSHAGFCAKSKRMAEIKNEKCYPELNMWIQPIFKDKSTPKMR